MANTYEIIAKVTVGSGGAANIEFTSIPATFDDVILLLSARHDASTSAGTISLNSSTSNFSYRTLYGTGSSAVSNTSSFGYFAPESTETANTFGNTSIYIPNYRGSTNKSISVDTVTENNATSALAGFFAILWSDTSAITSIKVTPNAGNFVQHSTAYLYGIKNS